MFRIQSTATVAVWTIGCALLGCSDVQRDTPPQAASQDHEPKTAAGAAQPITQYLNCRGTLTAMMKDHPWFDDRLGGHDIGTASLASFVLSEPAEHADRDIGILFKHAPRGGEISPPNLDDIGSEFTFQIPSDFLASTYTSIDNSSVKQLRKAEPTR